MTQIYACMQNNIIVNIVERQMSQYNNKWCDGYF